MKSLITYSCVILCIGSWSAPAAVIIGPGAGHTAGSIDGSGDRLNIDRALEFIPAATYSILEWQLNVDNHTRGGGGAGTVTPFIAELSNAGPREYQVLWLGDAFDPTSNGVQVGATYAPGVQTFAVSNPLNEVYAGFFSQNGGAQIIPFGSGQTDHDGAFTAPTAAGDFITGISNVGLGRSYAFEITVDPLTAIRALPEPSSVALWIVGLGIVQVVRNRRSNIDD